MSRHKNEATDELRRQIAEVIADYHGRMIQAHTLFRSYELAGELLPLVVAVVAEARTEGAIAALEDFDRRKSFGIENWRVHRDITNIVAALRGVGNQKVGVTVDDLALDEMDGNQNAEPRWSANRLEEVLREGLPDQNAEHQLKVQAFEHLRDLMEQLEDDRSASSPVEGG